MKKSELIQRIMWDGRVLFRNGDSRPLRANEMRLVVDAINSVWPDEAVQAEVSS